MVTRIPKHVILVSALLLVGCYAQAQNKGLFADKPKKLLIELKAGRGFLSSMAGEEGGEAKVFYGGGSLSYGMMLRNNFLGLGVGAEYVDMMNGSYDFPVFLNLQHYFSKDLDQGFFIGAKVGYIFGGKKTIPIIVYLQGEEVNGTIARSMQGIYGEVSAGYRFRDINFFAAYNYRVVGYETTLYPNGGMYAMPYSTSSRVMHVVMAGVSFMLF